MTGSPVPHAAVRLNGTIISQDTVTGDDGRYHFMTMLPGSYAVSVESDGYRSQKSNVTLATDHDEDTANFAVVSAYPCDFHVYNASGGQLAFWYMQADGPHLATIIDADKSVILPGMSHAMRVAADVPSPKMHWSPFTIACGRGDAVRFVPPLPPSSAASNGPAR
jgi:hypothetical protein